VPVNRIAAWTCPASQVARRCEALLALYQRRPRLVFNLTLLAIVASVLACLGLNALFDMGWRWWHVSPAAYERVEMGMTYGEVVAVLGQPASFEERSVHMLLRVPSPIEHKELWFRPLSDGWIAVMFDADNRVSSKVLSFPGEYRHQYLGEDELDLGRDGW
jgi:hypothetical protein